MLNINNLDNSVVYIKIPKFNMKTIFVIEELINYLYNFEKDIKLLEIFERNNPSPLDKKKIIHRLSSISERDKNLLLKKLEKNKSFLKVFDKMKEKTASSQLVEHFVYDKRMISKNKLFEIFKFLQHKKVIKKLKKTRIDGTKGINRFYHLTGSLTRRKKLLNEIKRPILVKMVGKIKKVKKLLKKQFIPLWDKWHHLRDFTTVISEIFSEFLSDSSMISLPKKRNREFFFDLIPIFIQYRKILSDNEYINNYLNKYLISNIKNYHKYQSLFLGSNVINNGFFDIWTQLLDFLALELGIQALMDFEINK